MVPKGRGQDVEDPEDRPSAVRVRRYVRLNGELVEKIEEVAQRARQRTREPVSISSVTRRLLWAAIESPKTRRQAGLL